MTTIVFPGYPLASPETEGLLGRVRQILEVHSLLTGGLPRVDSSLFAQQLQDNRRYYLLYSHPLQASKNKGFYTRGDELKAFLAASICPERGEGRDVWILPMSLDWTIGCNSNGEIFFKRLMTA